MQQLQQTYKSLDKQKQILMMEQIYYVFKDLANVLGIYAETLATLKYFENNPDHPYCTIAQNRLIAQINLSNAILFDQKLSYENDEKLFSSFSGFKGIAKEYFEVIKQKLDYNDKIDHLADHYLQFNIDNNNLLKQVTPLPFNKKADFNQKMVENIFHSMSQVSADLEDIKSGKQLTIPQLEEFYNDIKQRKENATKKLSENFPEEQDETQGGNEDQSLMVTKKIKKNKRRIVNGRKGVDNQIK